MELSQDCLGASALTQALRIEERLFPNDGRVIVDARQQLGEAIAKAYLERDVFRRDDLITVRWPKDLRARSRL